MTVPLWKMFTSTVGLVAVPGPRGVNVLACEWSYLVNKEPLWVAVAFGPRTASHDLLTTAGRFAVTFCADDQAALADFAGSCSVTEVDKATSADLRIAPGERTPYVEGGVMALECELRQTVPLPVHRLYLAEVVAAHVPPEPRSPLVKHGGMFHLGPPAGRTEVVTATRRLDATTVRVAASSPPSADPWHVTTEDLLVDLTVPPGTGRLHVARGTFRPGSAAVA